MLRGKCCTNVPEAEVFWVHNGQALRNLVDLAGALESMPAETFRHHVNKQKNDFSEWIRNSVKDDRLADAVARTVTKETIEILILRRIIGLVAEEPN